MRVFLIFLLLAVAFAVPFLIWGDHFESWLAGEGAVEWLRARGGWAAFAAVGLLVSDLLLPVPATAVMAALGLIYRPLVGGLVGGAGSMLAGLLAYFACRRFGRGAALRLAGAEDLARGERFFERAGGWAVALSRWMPLLPEVMACLAGLMKMKPGRFVAALACGSLPMAFAYATLGYLAEDRPALAIGISAAAPLVVWGVVVVIARGRKSG